MTSRRAALLSPLLAPLLAGASVPLSLGQDAAQRASEVDLVEVRNDRQDRMTVSVQIGEAGPYRFLIDTGAERTVVSRSIAEDLRLVPAGRATLMGVAGSLPVDMVEIDEIKLGRRSYYSLLTPLLESHHMGADGIIGIDGLQGQRVMLDFVRKTMAVSEAREQGGNRGFEIIVRAHRRAGQLIMTNAVIDGIKTDVVIDTGASTTIANRALQRALAKRGKLEQTSLLSVTGQRIVADLAIVRQFKVGNLELNGVQIAFVDAPPFARLDLHDKPALLLGMNELRVFKRVAIDFDSRKVLFDLPDAAVNARYGLAQR